TNVTVELAGAGLEKETGNRVEISGATDAAAAPVTDASQLIRVSSVKRVGKGCGAGKSSAAAAAGVGGAAGAGVGALAISATALAVIGGVAVAATVGGLAAAGKLPGHGSSGTPISR